MLVNWIKITSVTPIPMLIQVVATDESGSDSDGGSSSSSFSSLGGADCQGGREEHQVVGEVSWMVILAQLEVWIY